MSNWFATFTELLEAGIPLKVWLEFHKARRAEMTVEEKIKEGW